MNKDIDLPNSHVIYSDGACSGNPGVGGWGFIHWFPDNTIIEGSGFVAKATNNRMEMTAAMEGLKTVPHGDSAIVLTDSVYVIRGITQWIFGWQKRGWKNAEGVEILNKDIWEDLLRVTRGKKIEWRYIPGHKGFVGNERVDELAVGQSLRRPVQTYQGPYSFYRFPILPLPEFTPLPEMKKITAGSKEKSSGFYLSFVNGVLESHSKWDQCQARVKGVSQARFKKVSSNTEAAEIIRTWGLDPNKVVLKR